MAGGAVSPSSSISEKYSRVSSEMATIWFNADLYLGPSQCFPLCDLKLGYSSTVDLIFYHNQPGMVLEK